jgi:hypothetical protein
MNECWPLFRIMEKKKVSLYNEWSKSCLSSLIKCLFKFMKLNIYRNNSLSLTSLPVPLQRLFYIGIKWHIRKNQLSVFNLCVLQITLTMFHKIIPWLFNFELIINFKVLFIIHLMFIIFILVVCSWRLLNNSAKTVKFIIV